jgi:hypothetical protein
MKFTNNILIISDRSSSVKHRRFEFSMKYIVSCRYKCYAFGMKYVFLEFLEAVAVIYNMMSILKADGILKETQNCIYQCLHLYLLIGPNLNGHSLI